MPLSSTNESSSKEDQIAHKFFNKFALLLQNARTAPYIPSSRIDKWFNLETPDTDQFRDHLRLYRTISSATALPPFELQILLSIPELATDQVLVLSDLNASRSRVEPTPSHVLLESWVVVFSPDRQSRQYDDRPDVALSSVYKQSISVFRSMFTLLRVLPAWKLFKRLRRGSANSPESNHLGIQVRVADPANEARMLKFGTPLSSSASSLPTSSHAFPPVSHPLGTLTISTTYLLSPFFHIDTLESLLSSRFLSQDDESFTPTLAARQQTSFSASPMRTSLPRSPPAPSLADRFVLPATPSPLRGPPPVPASRGTNSAAGSLSRQSGGSGGSGGSRPTSMLPPRPESPRSGSGSGSPRFDAPDVPAPLPIRRPSINAIHPFKSSTLSSPSLHSPTASSLRHSPLSAGPSLPSRPSPSARTRLSSSPGTRPTYPPPPPSPMSIRAPGTSTSTRPSPPADRPPPTKRYSSSFGHRYAATGGAGSDGSLGKKSDERPGSASFLSTATDDDDISAFVQAIDARAPLSVRRPGTDAAEADTAEEQAPSQVQHEVSAPAGAPRKYRDRVDDELKRMNEAFLQSLAGLEGRPRRARGPGAGSSSSPRAPPDSPRLFGGSGSGSASASGSVSASGDAGVTAATHRRAGSTASGSDEIMGRLEFDDPAARL